MNWNILYAVVHVWLLCVVRAQYDNIGEQCRSDRPEHCFTLYRSTNGAIAWSTAQQECLKYNQALAIVPNADIQTFMSELIQTGSNTGVWTAGQVQNSDRWRRLNGNFVTTSEAGVGNCLYLYVGVSTDISTAHCTESRTAVCTYDGSVANCTEGGVLIGTLCWRELSGLVSWYTAVAKCEALGFKLVTYEAAFESFSPESFGTIQGNMWLDTYRYPWTWNTGSGFAKSMMYYNWDPQFGSNTPGHCMYIYGNGHQWKSQACDSTTGEVQHFVCEKDTTTTTTSTTTTPSTTTTTTTIAATTITTSPSQTSAGMTAASDDTTESVPGALSKMTLYIVIAAVVADVLLIIIIVVFVIVCRRKKKKQTDRRNQSRDQILQMISDSTAESSDQRGSGERGINGHPFYFGKRDKRLETNHSRQAGGSAQSKIKGMPRRTDTTYDYSDVRPDIPPAALVYDEPVEDRAPGAPLYDESFHGDDHDYQNDGWKDTSYDYVSDKAVKGKSPVKGSKNKKEKKRSSKEKKQKEGARNKGFSGSNDAIAGGQPGHADAAQGHKPSYKDHDYTNIPKGTGRQAPKTPEGHDYTNMTGVRNHPLTSAPARGQQQEAAAADNTNNGPSEMYAKVNKSTKGRGSHNNVNDQSDEDIVVDNSMYGEW